MRNLVDLKSLVSIEVWNWFDRKFNNDPWDYSLLVQIQEILPTLRRVFLLWRSVRVWVLETTPHSLEMCWFEQRMKDFTRWDMVTDRYEGAYTQAYVL